MQFHDMPSHVYSPYRPDVPWTRREKLFAILAAIGWLMYFLAPLH